MKRLIIMLLILLGSSALFRSTKNAPPFLDETIVRTIDYQDRVQSYTVHIEDYDAQGRRRADIDYVVDGKNWLMRNVAVKDAVKDTMFEWRKIRDDLFILNADTGWFWAIPDSRVRLPARVSVHDAIADVQRSIDKMKLAVNRVGSEPCGEHLCWRYQLVDPSFHIVERYWWIDSGEYRLMKDQFVIGNGETSITTYEYEREIEIEIPTLTRNAPADADVMTLPGIIKNLLTPSPQKSV